MPTVETPIIIRGNIESRGKNADWVDDDEGSLMKIIYGEIEYQGKVKQKQICFGKEKATVLLNAKDAIKDFALE